MEGLAVIFEKLQPWNLSLINPGITVNNNELQKNMNEFPEL